MCANQESIGIDGNPFITYYSEYASRSNGSETLCWCELEDIDDEALALMHDVSKTASVHFEGKAFSVSELL